MISNLNTQIHYQNKARNKANLPNLQKVLHPIAHGAKLREMAEATEDESGPFEP
jgi:hypothetical protein